MMITLILIKSQALQIFQEDF